LSKTQQVQLRQLLKVDAGLILLASGNARNRAQTARAIAQDLVAPDRKIACADIPGHPWLPRVTQLAMDQLAAADQQQLWSAVCELGCDAIVAWQSSSDEMVRQLARQASESTLVVQGLGVNTPADAVARMLSMGVRSEALARSLTAIVLQTPLQSLCPWCRSMQTPDDQGTAWLSTHSPIKSGNINDWLRQRMRSSFSTAEGCDRCQHTGRGKSLDLFTIVTLDDAVTDALYGSDIRLALTRLREKPFMTRDLLRLAQEGIISLAEAARLVPVC
jgi:MSHA biogenesis protein MshE